MDIAVKKPPVAYRSCFKWCESTLLSQIMKKTLKTSHFELVSSDDDWRGFWGKHLRTIEYKSLTYFQRVNHYPGDFHIGRKDKLWMHLLEMSRRFPEFDIMPYTYVLPKDHDQLSSYLGFFLVFCPVIFNGSFRCNWKARHRETTSVGTWKRNYHCEQNGGDFS